MDKKLLIGITIGGAAVAALYFVSKKKKNYATVETENSEPVAETEEKKEDVTVKEKIEAYTEKFVDWFVTHQIQISAITSAVSLMTGLFNLKNAATQSMVSLDEKKFDDYISNKVQSKSDKIVTGFLDSIIENDGLMATRLKDDIKITAKVTYPKEAAA